LPADPQAAWRTSRTSPTAGSGSCQAPPVDAGIACLPPAAAAPELRRSGPLPRPAERGTGCVPVAGNGPARTGIFGDTGTSWFPRRAGRRSGFTTGRILRLQAGMSRRRDAPEARLGLVIRRIAGPRADVSNGRDSVSIPHFLRSLFSEGFSDARFHHVGVQTEPHVVLSSATRGELSSACLPPSSNRCLQFKARLHAPQHDAGPYQLRISLLGPPFD